MSRIRTLTISLVAAAIAMSATGCGLLVEGAPRADTVVYTTRVVQPRRVVIRTAPTVIRVTGRTVSRVVARQILRATVKHAVRRIRIVKSRRIVRR